MLGALDFAVRTNAELVSCGVPAGIVTSERERLTGHVRRIQPRWARSIGYWGGITGLLEIAERVDVGLDTAKNYAKYRGLKWRTPRRSYTPAQLGVLALATPGSSVEAARKLGIMPVEAAMYRAAITEVLVENTTSLEALLSWTPSRLHRAWQELELSIEAPEVETDLFSPESLRAVVAEAERLLSLEEP